MTKVQSDKSKIEQLLQSENYEAGFELLKTINNEDLTEALTELIKNTVREKYFDEYNFEDGFKVLRNLFPNLTCIEWECIGVGMCIFTETLDDLGSMETELRLTYRYEWIYDFGYEIPEELPLLPNITSLDLSSCESIQNVDGIDPFRMTEIPNLTNLGTLYLNQCFELQNVDGLANFKNLKCLELYECDSLQNIDGLANLPNLTSLVLGSCDKVNPKPSIKKMITREEVAAYQEKIKKAMK